MKKYFNWCIDHFYEICIFFAGVYLESAIWYRDKGDWGSVIFYISMCIMFLTNAKMEKKRYGK